MHYGWKRSGAHIAFWKNSRAKTSPEVASIKKAQKVIIDYQLTLAVWLSGNALASINVVALRQTRLVLGWVTVCGRVNHFGM